jgi:hypothetical protein
MFKQGDIVEIIQGAPYAATRSGTKWMVYGTFYDGNIRVGTPPINDYSKEDMIRLYSGSDSRTTRRKYDAGVKMYIIESQFCKLSGNNSTFKDRLLQGDIWEEENKKSKVSLRDTTWEDSIPW